MDPRTIAFFMLLSGVECSLLFFAAGDFRGNPTGLSSSPSLLWGGGTVTYVLGFGALLLQGTAAPIWLGYILSNSLIVLGLLLLLAGIRRLAGRRPATARYTAFWAVYTLLTIVFTYGFDSITMRIVCFSLALAALYAEGAVLVLAARPEGVNMLPVLLAGTFGVFVLFFVFRAVATVVSPPTSIFVDTRLNLASYLAAHVGLVGWSLGLILLQNRRMEADLERSSAEKSVLLRELQHRIKNSISVIVSLVRLESSRVEDDRFREILDGLRSRIAAIGALYEQLSRSGETERVDLDVYLRGMAETLFAGQGAAVRGIRLELSLDPVVVGGRQAVSIGIAAHELISDCLKHGFPGGRSGTVRITLRADGPEAVLEIGDDGVGLPAGFAVGASDGLGLVLAKMLSEQAGGAFSFASENGVRFTMRVPRTA